MSRFALILLAAPAFVGGSALAGDRPGVETTSEKIIALGREDNRAMEHLDILVNRIGPRLTSSDGLTNACEWARDRFKSFGIENARIEQWGEFPVGFNRGPWSGQVVDPEARTLTFGTNSWTAGTSGVTKGIALPEPTNAEGLDAVKDKLAGAWILAPAGRAGGGAEFRKALEEAYAKAPIAGIVRPIQGDRIITGGSFRVDWDNLPTIPVVNLLKTQYDEIVAWIKEDKLVTLQFDIRNYFKKGPIPLYNVIADIPGTEKPDEYVIVGGHIDSWDGATGTTDNGTGCATTLEAARLLMLSGAKPKRTIRFMLWSGEEQGLLGSRAYVRAHPELMPKISAVLVHDGGTNYLSGIGVTPGMKADIEQAFASVVGLNPDMPFRIREIPAMRAAGASDHSSFIGGGAPGFFWGQSGKAVYPRTHHTQYDTFDAAIPEYQKHSSIVAALGALGIADLDNMLSRDGVNEPGGNAPTPPGRRLLGVQLDELTIEEVVEGGVAEKSGFKPGDVILKVEGKIVTTREEFSAAIQAANPAQKITVRRGDQTIELGVTFPAASPR